VDPVHQVLALPGLFRSRGDVSMVELLAGTTYRQEYANITEAELARGLRAAPGLARDWLQYAEDQRCSDCWFLSERADGGWKVGFLDRHGTVTATTSHDSLEDACARFAKQKLERLRGITA